MRLRGNGISPYGFARWPLPVTCDAVGKDTCVGCYVQRANATKTQIEIAITAPRPQIAETCET